MLNTKTKEVDVILPQPHPKQLEFLRSKAKRKIIRAGRRGGKTYGSSIFAVEQFLEGKRVLYAAPTQEQIDRFWHLICESLREAISKGIFYKNETKHVIELETTEQRIRAKTAWNADTLRGDYADVLILDEFQLMNEDTWEVVGAPMLLDNNGDAIFIYTPPSLRSRSVTKANDPQHAAKLFKKAQADTSGRWQAFTFTTYDNPHIPKEAIDDLASDMSSVSYRMEIMAEDIDEAPGALWRRSDIEKYRVDKAPELTRIVVGIDPSGSDKTTSDEAGIMVAGTDSKGEGYILQDLSGLFTPNGWAYKAIQAYIEWEADRIIGESNYGGDMVETIIKNLSPDTAYKSVVASRGKYLRAEPIAALYERGKVHHVGRFNKLEDEMCLWLPGDKSPNRMDALVWCLTELMTIQQRKFFVR
jgi:hypothetical protein